MKKLTLSRFFIITLPRILMIGFILCVLLSMYLYKGGIFHMTEGGISTCPGVSCTDNGHWTTGYLFFKNFLSDLGRTATHGGHINFHSSLLFNVALTFSGVTYILFYSFLKNIFPIFKIIYCISFWMLIWIQLTRVFFYCNPYMELYKILGFGLWL